MTERTELGDGWSAVLHPATARALGILLAGVLLHSMNVLLLATIIPSIVADIRGDALIAWPTTAYLASSIVASTLTGRLTVQFGAGRTYSCAAFVFALGALASAAAPVMEFVIFGRFLQGFGGGLLSALAYVLARRLFAPQLLPRVFTLLTSVWSVSALVGPFVGGVFVTYATWRAAFIAVAVLAGAIGLAALRALPAQRDETATARQVPGLLIGLVAAAIVLMSLASIAGQLTWKILLIVAAVAAMALMVDRNRRSSTPLLPSDAFSLRTETGIGLWLALLLCVAFSPVHLYVPVLLQKLHGVAPIAAGYAVAGAAVSWTVVALVVAPVPRERAWMLLALGPLLVAAGLLALSATLVPGPVMAILAALLLIGAGMGTAWSFTAERIMARPRAGEGDLAASSVATVQQTGFALGSALAGIVANLVGFSVDGGLATLGGTATIVPVVFAVTAATAAGAGLLLGRSA